MGNESTVDEGGSLEWYTGMRRETAGFLRFYAKKCSEREGDGISFLILGFWGSRVHIAIFDAKGPSMIVLLTVSTHFLLRNRLY